MLECIMPLKVGKTARLTSLARRVFGGVAACWTTSLCTPIPVFYRSLSRHTDTGSVPASWLSILACAACLPASISIQISQQLIWVKHRMQYGHHWLLTHTRNTALIHLQGLISFLLPEHTCLQQNTVVNTDLLPEVALQNLMSHILWGIVIAFLEVWQMLCKWCLQLMCWRCVKWYCNCLGESENKNCGHGRLIDPLNQAGQSPFRHWPQSLCTKGATTFPSALLQGEWSTWAELLDTWACSNDRIELML